MARLYDLHLRNQWFSSGSSGSSVTNDTTKKPPLDSRWTSSLFFNLLDGQNAPEFDDSSVERCQLQWNSNLYGGNPIAEGQTYWIVGWYLFDPTWPNYTAQARWQTVMEIHPESGSGNTANNASLALEVFGLDTRIVRTPGPGFNHQYEWPSTAATTGYPGTMLDRGNWHYYRMGFKHTTGGTGFLTVYRDNVLVLNRTGIPTSSGGSNYYPMIGPYRNSIINGAAKMWIAGCEIHDTDPGYIVDSGTGTPPAPVSPLDDEPAPSTGISISVSGVPGTLNIRNDYNATDRATYPYGWEGVEPANLTNTSFFVRETAPASGLPSGGLVAVGKVTVDDTRIYRGSTANRQVEPYNNAAYMIRNEVHYFGFSVFVPTDFNAGNYNLFWSLWSPWLDNLPAVYLNYENTSGKLVLAAQGGDIGVYAGGVVIPSTARRWYIDTAFERNKWHHFIVKVKVAPDLNGQIVVARRKEGVTAYTELFDSDKAGASGYGATNPTGYGPYTTPGAATQYTGQTGSATYVGNGKLTQRFGLLASQTPVGSTLRRIYHANYRRGTTYDIILATDPGAATVTSYSRKAAILFGASAPSPGLDAYKSAGSLFVANRYFDNYGTFLKDVRVAGGETLYYVDFAEIPTQWTPITEENRVYGGYGKWDQMPDSWFWSGSKTTAANYTSSTGQYLANIRVGSPLVDNYVTWAVDFFKNRAAPNFDGLFLTLLGNYLNSAVWTQFTPAEREEWVKGCHNLISSLRSALGYEVIMIGNGRWEQINFGLPVFTNNNVDIVNIPGRSTTMGKGGHPGLNGRVFTNPTASVDDALIKANLQVAGATHVNSPNGYEYATLAAGRKRFMATSVNDTEDNANTKIGPLRAIPGMTHLNIAPSGYTSTTQPAAIGVLSTKLADHYDASNPPATLDASNLWKWTQLSVGDAEMRAYDMPNGARTALTADIADFEAFAVTNAARVKVVQDGVSRKGSNALLFEVQAADSPTRNTVFYPATGTPFDPGETHYFGLSFRLPSSLPTSPSGILASISCAVSGQPNVLDVRFDNTIGLYVIARGGNVNPGSPTVSPNLVLYPTVVKNKWIDVIIKWVNDYQNGEVTLWARQPFEDFTQKASYLGPTGLRDATVAKSAFVSAGLTMDSAPASTTQVRHGLFGRSSTFSGIETYFGPKLVGDFIVGRTDIGPIWKNFSSPGIKIVNAYNVNVPSRMVKLTGYFDGNGTGSGDSTVIGVLYTDNGSDRPLNLVAFTNPLTITKGQAAGFQDLVFADPLPSLGIGKYWIGYIMTGTSGRYARYGA